MDRGDTVHLEDYVKGIEATQTWTSSSWCISNLQVFNNRLYLSERNSQHVSDKK